VNTFLRDRELARVRNLNLLDWLGAAGDGQVLDLVDDVVALEDFAEDDVPAVEPTIL
jgi:hypothetical protein